MSNFPYVQAAKDDKGDGCVWYIECDAWGEFDGNADGFRAIWLRDEYQNNAG